MPRREFRGSFRNRLCVQAGLTRREAIRRAGLQDHFAGRPRPCNHHDRDDRTGVAGCHPPIERDLKPRFAKPAVESFDHTRRKRSRQSGVERCGLRHGLRLRNLSPAYPRVLRSAHFRSGIG